MGQKVDHVDNVLLYLISLDPNINQFSIYSMIYSVPLSCHRSGVIITC